MSVPVLGSFHRPHLHRTFSKAVHLLPENLSIPQRAVTRGHQQAYSQNHVSRRHLSSYRQNTTMKISPVAFKEGSTCPPLARDTLRLYSMRFCPYALRTRLVLTHKDIEYETVNVNLKLKPGWFLAKNPKGLVPVLEYNDKIVYESVICNDYLDEVYPKVKLNPEDPYALARQRMLMEHFSPIATGFHKMAFSKNEEAKKRAMDKLFSAIELFEAELTTPYYGGSAPGMLDFFAYPHLSLLQFNLALNVGTSPAEAMGILPVDTPRIGAWVQRMKRHPTVLKNTEKEEDMAAFLKSIQERAEIIQYDAGLQAAKL